MRYTFSIILLAAIFISCKKDKYTTAPQLTYKGVTPNTYRKNFPIQNFPIITLNITDAEGDIGFINGSDTSKLFIKNLVTGIIDSSLFLPNISSISTKKFEANIEIVINGTPSALTAGTSRPSPKTDTLYYEIYTKDFAKNKSNIVKTTDPVFIITP